MKSNVPKPVIIAAIVAVVAVIAIVFIRGMVVEPETPRPNIYGGPNQGSGDTYPGQGGGGAQTPLNSGG